MFFLCSRIVQCSVDTFTYVFFRSSHLFATVYNFLKLQNQFSNKIDNMYLSDRNNNFPYMTNLQMKRTTFVLVRKCGSGRTSYENLVQVRET